MSTDIRVALVYEQEAGSELLRTALANAGVQIAVQRRASALDADAVLASEVDAIVVNLDPELEDLLDTVTEVLDRARQPVIFNDPAASSDLSGWDRARWLRHLSAKLKGKTDVTPPPPPGAHPIPTPLRAPEPAPPMPPVLASTPSAAEAVAQVPAEGAPVEVPVAEKVPDFDIGLADLGEIFEPVEPSVAALPPVVPVALTVGEEIDELDSLFATIPDLDVPTPAVAAEPIASVAQPETAEFAGSEIDLDGLFSEAVSVEVTGPEVEAANPAELSELDALFAASPEVGGSASVTLASPAELNDLDALFRDFAANQQVEASAPRAPEARPAGVAPAAGEPAEPPQSGFAGLSLNWSLEEIPEESPASTTMRASDIGRLVNESRLDVPAKPIAAKVQPAAAPAPPPPKPAAPAAASPGEGGSYANFQLEDMDFALDAPDVRSAPAPQAEKSDRLAEFNLEGLELSADFTGETEASASAATGEESISIADLDLDFGLEDATPAGSAGGGASDPDLDDIDALFAPSSPAPTRSLSLPDLNRVFVLGASIGGPEAIKAFLARLPVTVPAAFIVAQHMGSEFLEMMAAQLDAATALAVRYPKAGERLRHGEVLVAPANEHLALDESGRVQLNAVPGNSPYNPSIDQLVRDAADRFGDHATLILFSGMGADAVEGGRYLTGKGGQVWAQDRASCVIATMIDSARQQGLLRFEGSPVQLAERVLELAG